jgi:GNAT superfamily N-acetyltransferase
MNFREFYNKRKYLLEVRYSDREYYNEESPWRLTFDEYLYATNKSGKIHNMDAYEPRDVHELEYDSNPPVEVAVYDDKNAPKGFKAIHYKLKDGTFGILPRRSEGEVSGDKESLIKLVQSFTDSDKKYKTIKGEYWFTRSDGYNISNFPYRIMKDNNIGIDYRINKKIQKYCKWDDEKLEHIRDEDGNIVYYTDDEIRKMGKRPYEITVGAFDINDNNKPIGMAMDEWGCILVEVNHSHRGKGIGKTLVKIYRCIYKNKESGGYTIHGIHNARSLHRDAVNDALKLGWYERAIRDNILTKEKVDEIINSSIKK